MEAPRMLVVFTLAVFGVVLIIAALATEQWWLLPIALLAHGAGTVVALGYMGKALGQGDKPDPVTAARLAEQKEGHDSSDDDQGDDEPRMAI